MHASATGAGEPDLVAPRRHAVLARRAADGGRRDPPARRRTTARTRWRRRRSASPAASSPRRVREGLASFAGVPHRLEEVGTVDGVTYVNDSKATNVASAEVADPLLRRRRAPDRRRPRQGLGLRAAGRAGRASAARRVYLIGETAAALHDALLATGVPLHDCGDLERAVAAGARGGRPGDVVLLSPGCASYDQYRSYEERGDHFRALVAALR